MATASSTRQDLDAAVPEMVKIIVDGWNPQQIILFGSRARGDHHDQSDVDLLVVLDEAADRGKLGRQIRCRTRVHRVRQRHHHQHACRHRAPGHRNRYRRTRRDAGRTHALRSRQRGPGDGPNSPSSCVAQPAISGWPKPVWLLARRNCRRLVITPSRRSRRTIKSALMVDRITYPFTHELEQLLPLVPIAWGHRWDHRRPQRAEHVGLVPALHDHQRTNS